ncbi:MAG TPA: OmpA family protein [Pyrinomonadaceae bacterium]|jgi:outer membrane protein OmpA-like peptidoglycan-associated protein|nr:OmpA family protein [Pyrinomonadaceae bacterium]
MIKRISVIFLSIMLGAVSLFAQNAQLRNAVSGQKYKLKGVIVAKENDSTFIVRDTVGVDTRIVIEPNASVKSNGGFLGGGDKYAMTALVRGLNLEVEGRGDANGAVSANKVRFSKANLQTAQSIDARVSPAEERLTAAEQNAQRVSGQIDELTAISNAAKGGAKAAQDTADAAVAGVNATNKRIGDLDDYAVQSTATVNFKVGSSILSPDAKASLDQVAAAATSLKGYVIEVTGFASADGDTRKNKVLSERRAQAVKDYLIENHNIPLRRMSTSYGYGELQAVADNTTREGREQNRRVEVKLLVSRGINQNVEVKSQTDNIED